MKKFVHQFLILTSVILIAVMSINYYTDTLGVLNDDFSIPKSKEPNQHFVKIRYLINNPNKYDAYCFGSSRVGNLDLRKIDNEYHYYNMTYSEGLPQEWLNDIKILIKHDVRISQIMLGIDDFSFRVNPKTHESQYLRKPYKNNNFKTYMTLLLKKPSTQEVKTFIANKGKGGIFDIYDTGRPLHPHADERIEKNAEAHINDKKFQRSGAYKGNRIDETIKNIQEIKDIAVANNIDLIVFINPIHKTTYLGNNLAEFNEFKRQLAEITNYYDFSGLNYITGNNYNYYETSHYRPLVGNIMLNRIFNQPANLKTDFRIYVTPQNINEHISFLESQVVSLNQ